MSAEKKYSYKGLFISVNASFENKTLAYILVVLLPLSFLILNGIITDFTARKLTESISDSLREQITSESLLLQQTITTMLIIGLLIVLANHFWYLMELSKELNKFKKIKNKNAWLALVGFTFALGAAIFLFKRKSLE